MAFGVVFRAKCFGYGQDYNTVISNVGAALSQSYFILRQKSLRISKEAPKLVLAPLYRVLTTAWAIMQKNLYYHQIYHNGYT